MFGRKLDRPRLSPSGTADGHLRFTKTKLPNCLGQLLKVVLGVNNTNIVHSKSRLL